MKILLFGDAHHCARSSIITKFGQKYPIRLENMIRTFAWIKDQALENQCEAIIGLGDLFNTSQLSDIEITAAKEFSFAKIPTYLLVGNHESSLQDLSTSSTKLLENTDCKVISEPTSFSVDGTEICLLPYITECIRKPLAEYFPCPTNRSKRVILSHNDINGISYGPVMSVTGFTIQDIEAACDLFINAHIHNGQQITEKIYNIGNITGQNFSEDAFKYSHNIIILDTDDLSLKFIENPHAFNFYKLQIETEPDIQQLYSLKSNAVISIKCNSTLVEKTKQIVNKLTNILESRIIITRDQDDVVETSSIDLSVDHLARFIECCRSSIEASTILEEELAEICK